MQERHYPGLPTSPSNLRPGRGAWLTSLGALAAAAALALLGTGCPEAADLDNPEMYPKPGGATGGSAAGGSAAGGGAAAGSATGGGTTSGNGNGTACETACMGGVLDLCVGCHGAIKSAMLDLSAGYTSRLKDVAATHGDIQGGGSGCPSGDKLIDSSNVASSWLLKKVTSAQGGCGDAMPPGTGLMGDDLKCMQDYVSCVAGGM